MRLLIVYQPESEYARAALDFAHDFTHLHPDLELELIDADSIEAESLAEVYDIVQYPTTLVLTEDGTMQNMWSGHTMPLMNEVLGYLNV